MLDPSPLYGPSAVRKPLFPCLADRSRLVQNQHLIGVEAIRPDAVEQMEEVPEKPDATEPLSPR
ncbi:MAG: hypothetical protein PHP75_06385 [Methylacidiphilaceae bacterium]|nr:hypothetical protein [Candidatus Methylacidiphilaceae bacterium]